MHTRSGLKDGNVQTPAENRPGDNHGNGTGQKSPRKQHAAQITTHFVRQTPDIDGLHPQTWSSNTPYPPAPCHRSLHGSYAVLMVRRYRSPSSALCSIPSSSVGNNDDSAREYVDEFEGEAVFEGEALEARVIEVGIGIHRQLLIGSAWSCRPSSSLLLSWLCFLEFRLVGFVKWKTTQAKNDGRNDGESKGPGKRQMGYLSMKWGGGLRRLDSTDAYIIQYALLRGKVRRLLGTRKMLKKRHETR